MGEGATLSPTGGRTERMPGFEAHFLDIDGTSMSFQTIEHAADFTPMYRGLPDDRCQSHHWGYVIVGRMILHRPEGDIVAEAGEAYYIGPGHTGESGLAGTRVVEFSPTDEMAQTMEAIARNLAEMDA